jgi:replication factor C subunit 3/5
MSKAAAARETKMWVEKYRPEMLGEVISQKNVIDTITKLVDARKMPHLLFYGPPGTGKTTTILACARQLNGKSFQSMTLELNASDDRGIAVIREQIKTFASTKQKFSKGFKLIILDEADAMTSAAQFALRRVIEKYTKNCRFCLICNYVNKIIPALQSRCTKFRFAPLERTDIDAHLRDIAKRERVTLTDDGLASIIRLSNGDMRKCLNIMQATHTSYPERVDLTAVHLTTGAPMPKDIETIMHSLLNENFSKAYATIRKMQLDKGLALVDIVTGVHRLVLRMKLPSMMLCQVLKELADLEHRLSVATQEKVQLAALVGVFQIVRNELYKASKKSASPRK